MKKKSCWRCGQFKLLNRYPAKDGAPGGGICGVEVAAGKSELIKWPIALNAQATSGKKIVHSYMAMPALPREKGQWKCAITTIAKRSKSSGSADRAMRRGTKIGEGKSARRSQRQTRHEES